VCFIPKCTNLTLINDANMAQVVAGTVNLVIPFLVQVIYQSVLVFVSPSSPPIFVAERDTAVTPTGWHKAGAGRGEDNEHILGSVSTRVTHDYVLPGRLTAMKRYIPAHMA
jgi:hypothetical protein